MESRGSEGGRLMIKPCLKSLPHSLPGSTIGIAPSLRASILESQLLCRLELGLHFELCSPIQFWFVVSSIIVIFSAELRKFEFYKVLVLLILWEFIKKKLFHFMYMQFLNIVWVDIYYKFFFLYCNVPT